MDIRPLSIDGLWELHAPIRPDSRGFLFKPFDSDSFAPLGRAFIWQQVIQSHTDHAGTLRGLYVQTAPYTEGKLVTCLAGGSFWVAVDLRRNSPSFGQWESVELHGGDGRSLVIAPGFAHGCISLTDNVDLLLLADNQHSDDHGVGIAWNDPDLAIRWPQVGHAHLSGAHAAYPSFADFRKRIGGL
ncbi:MAG: dTDP-4-dehydrorhamnose 3,5-epimerase family protein [Rhodospirillaceae bacterium]|nr:dTDP-4-dehydrorhamnose 3,5-epimerase family protein [Rhodospirillaceae bacterium]